MNRELSELENNRLMKVESADSDWDRWSQIIGHWIPYVTLAVSTILSQVRPEQSWITRVETAVLVALAAGWVYFMFSRVPDQERGRPVRMLIYFSGLMVFAAILMFHHPIFFVFTITGFFHASLLRPWSLVFLGVATTSILINTIITDFPWPTIEGWIIFPTIIVIQTLAIGFGMVVGEKLAELSEQRKQAVARLEAALEENAGLHTQLLVQAREAGIFEERQRMAREIHDTLAQGLVGIITQLGALEQAKNRPEDWQRHLDNALFLARESLAEARRSVDALRPEQLNSGRLPEAIAEVAQQWSVLNGVRINVTTAGEPIQLHPEIEEELLRTAQEALANTAKHARATRVGVTLSYLGDVVILDVRDNGVGFVCADQVGTNGNGFGLTAMRQRMSRVAGSLSIESEPGNGTAISARVPAIAAVKE